jgi:hypothetical protein
MNFPRGEFLLKTPTLLSSFCFFLGISLVSFSSASGLGQDTAPQGVSAANLLAQLSAVFSNSNVMQQVELSGSATWHAGSLEDTGTVTLTASTNGSSQMQLELARTGQKTETQTGTGYSAYCQWAGADGVAHTADLGNCWKPSVWFFPAISLQPSLLPSYLNAVDLGTGRVGSSENIYRHLQSQLVFPNFTSQMSENFAGQSTTDLGLDPTTLLPAVLAYSVHPDNGNPAKIAIEIRYSDYRAVDGVQVPFHIERYINGSLQLDILISSAHIN